MVWFQSVNQAHFTTGASFQSVNQARFTTGVSFQSVNQARFTTGVSFQSAQHGFISQHGVLFQSIKQAI